MRTLTRQMLEEHGYIVVEASDGPSALERLASNATPIHLALTDVAMPGMSGPELGARLILAHPAMKVVYASGYTGELLPENGLSRARVCELVKGSGDPGDESWTLRGRIVDFAEVVAAGGNCARVGIELWLEAGNRVLFHDELTHDEAIVGRGDEATVQALSRGVAHVVAGVVERMRAHDLFAAARAAAPASRVAVPPR